MIMLINVPGKVSIIEKLELDLLHRTLKFLMVMFYFTEEIGRKETNQQNRSYIYSVVKYS